MCWLARFRRSNAAATCGLPCNRARISAPSFSSGHLCFQSCSPSSGYVTSPPKSAPLLYAAAVAFAALVALVALAVVAGAGFVHRSSSGGVGTTTCGAHPASRFGRPRIVARPPVELASGVQSTKAPMEQLRSSSVYSWGSQRPNPSWYTKCAPHSSREPEKLRSSAWSWRQHQPGPLLKLLCKGDRDWGRWGGSGMGGSSARGGS